MITMSQAGSQAGSAFILGSYVAGCLAQVERLPGVAESATATAFLLQPGGKGFNMLAGLHRLGIATDGILPVGDDLWGRMTPALLGELRLPGHWLLALPGPSGGAVGFADALGSSSLAVFCGANARLSAGHVEACASRISGAALLASAFEMSDDAILAAFRLARAGTTRTLLNPSPYRRIDPRLLALTSLLVVNEVEAACLAAELGMEEGKTDDPASFLALARALQEKGVETVIVTLGAAGAVAFASHDTPRFQPAFPVPVADTTGAGDAFNAGLMAALLHGRPLAEALRQAAACGAAVTRGLGVIDHLPDQAALRDLAGKPDQKPNATPTRPPVDLPDDEPATPALR